MFIERNVNHWFNKKVLLGTRTIVINKPNKGTIIKGRQNKIIGLGNTHFPSPGIVANQPHQFNFD